MCLKEYYFLDCWRSHWWSLYLRMLGERSTAKKVYSPVSLLSMVTKVFQKLISGLVDCLETCGPFSDFQYSFRSSRSTTDLQTVVSDRFTTAFNRV